MVKVEPSVPAKYESPETENDPESARFEPLTLSDHDLAFPVTSQTVFFKTLIIKRVPFISTSQP
jgi:hypothetical protein